MIFIYIIFTMDRHDIDTKTNYVQELFAKEDTNLAQIYGSLGLGEKQMQISATEGKILYMLSQLIGAKKIIELGTLAGYSSIWMARSLPQNGQLIAIEKDVDKIARIRQNFIDCAVADKAQVICGEALDVLESLSKDAFFDMIFIDADKGNYHNYLDWAEKNIRKGGLIIGDNSFLFDQVYLETCPNPKQEKQWQAMREFNLRLSDVNKYTSIILPTSDGMTVAIKNF